MILMPPQSTSSMKWGTRIVTTWGGKFEFLRCLSAGRMEVRDMTGSRVILRKEHVAPATK